jgi:putative tryptophan/tyrosine transport system substrate-binding protein
MRRRDFIAGLGGAAAWPAVARTQQAALPVIGWLSVWEPRQNPSYVAAFRKGLNEAGYTEGQNVAIEFRWSGEQPDQLPTLAADLVRRRVSVIIADTNAVLAAKAATSSIPIVFASGGDPVEMRLVASFNSPSGNITGASFLSDDLLPKKLELLHEVVPRSPLIGFLVNPTLSVAASLVANLQPAARALGLELQVLNASNDGDIDAAFNALVERHAGALLIQGGLFFSSRIGKLAALAARHRMPAMYSLREFAVAGGLLAYGTSPADAYRIVGGYAARILKGEKPGDLPVQQSTKVELVINLKAAMAFGIELPTALLVRADEVIE